MKKYIKVGLLFILSQLCLASAMYGTAKYLKEEAPGCTRSNKAVTAGLSSLRVYSSMANDDVWAAGRACGDVYCLICKGAKYPSKPSPCRDQASVLVSVQGVWPESGATFILSPECFAAIADPGVGDVIEVEYIKANNTAPPECKR